MDEIFKPFLDKLAGADFWIALGFLVAGYVCWRWIGTTATDKKKVLLRQIGIALLIAVLAAGVILMNHLFFLRERAFPKNLTGVLVTRIMGDNASDSLQGDLVGKLNAELQKEATGEPIEVHASSEMVNENNGLEEAHDRARAIGRRLNAKIVIWGRKIGEQKFYPRITVRGKCGCWTVFEPDRTHEEQSITEAHLPDELVDEPFYLIDFIAGYSYFLQNNCQEALPHFKAALRRKGALPNELADLQFFTAVCLSWRTRQENMAANLLEAIGLFEKAARVYQTVDQEKQAVTLTNLGILYSRLPSGDRVANTQKAMAKYDEAIRVDPECAPAYCNRGSTYQDKGDYDKAIADYNEAIRLDPNSKNAYFNRGNAYKDKGDYDKARADYNKAIRVDPGFTKAYCNRGGTYLMKGNYDKAIADYNEAIRLNPKLAKPYDLRGSAYGLKGDYDKAIADYNEAIRLNPKAPDGYNSFAWLLGTCPKATVRDGKKALEYAIKACQVSEWKHPPSIDTLAAAYAEVGDFENAIKWEMKYLGTSNLSEKESADAKSRLALYQAHRPYHREK